MSGEKFGRVFTKGQDGDGTAHLSSWKEIPFVCFSNSDLTWYGPDGDVPEQFRRYQGYSFSLGFPVTVITESGEETFVGRLNTGCRLGDIQPRSVSRCEDSAAMNSYDIDNPVINKLTQVEHLDTLSALMRANSSSCRGNGRLLYYVLPCVLCDSLKNKDVLQNMKLSYKQLNLVMGEIMDYVRNNANDAKPGGLSNLLSIITPSALRNIKLSQLRLIQQSYQINGQLARGIREEALNICENDVNLVEPFIQSILYTSHQGCLENCKEYRETSFPEGSPLPQEISYGSRGYQIILEAVALEMKIFVGKEVRETHLFKRFVHHFVTQMGTIHDIFAMTSSSSSSSDCSKDSKETILNRIHEANDNLKEFLDISDLLLKVHDDGIDKEEGIISGFIKTAKQVMCGFLQWQAYRQPKLVFDCCVEQ